MRSEGYNPIDYIRSTQDIMKLASMITYSVKSENVKCDPYWDQQELILSCALIGYSYETLEMPNGKKQLIRKLILQPADVRYLAFNGSITINNCSHTRHKTTEGTDIIAVYLCGEIFREYQLNGALPEKCSVHQ